MLQEHAFELAIHDGPGVPQKPVDLFVLTAVIFQVDGLLGIYTDMADGGGRSVRLRG